jgi:hypothetical protein
MRTPLVLARFLYRFPLLTRISPLAAGRHIFLIHLVPVHPSLQRHRCSSAVWWGDNNAHPKRHSTAAL